MSHSVKIYDTCIGCTQCVRACPTDVLEVGQHFYWKIGGFQVHAQVLITSWVVIAILLGSAIVAVRNPQTRSANCSRIAPAPVEISRFRGSSNIQKLLSNSRTSRECWGKPEKFG